jgi:hypothetical protein
VAICQYLIILGNKVRLLQCYVYSFDIICLGIVNLDTTSEISAMSNTTRHQLLTYIIAVVWFINGFICKVLNLVPRHREIVERILGNEHAASFTITIGISETLMAVWILSRIRSRLNAVIQIIVIATMNTIEFILAPDLLLWGRWNAFFAFLFILLIFYNEFYFRKKLALQV